MSDLGFSTRLLNKVVAVIKKVSLVSVSLIMNIFCLFGDISTAKYFVFAKRLKKGMVKSFEKKITCFNSSMCNGNRYDYRMWSQGF